MIVKLNYFETTLNYLMNNTLFNHRFVTFAVPSEDWFFSPIYGKLVHRWGQFTVDLCGKTIILGNSRLHRHLSRIISHSDRSAFSSVSVNFASFIVYGHFSPFCITLSSTYVSMGEVCACVNCIHSSHVSLLSSLCLTLFEIWSLKHSVSV